MEDNYIGIMLSYEISLIKNEDDEWEGSMSVINKRTVDGETWEDTTVSFSNRGTDQTALVKDLVNTFNFYLQKTDGDLFNKPELK
jgi:hypothetical protein